MTPQTNLGGGALVTLITFVSLVLGVVGCLGSGYELWIYFSGGRPLMSRLYFSGMCLTASACGFLYLVGAPVRHLLPVLLWLMIEFIAWAIWHRRRRVHDDNLVNHMQSRNYLQHCVKERS